MYVKLFGTILESTLWVEGNAPTRLLWITMLAMANKHGVVEASVPGLAHRARISLEECEKALETLMGPDTYSRTKGRGGARIEETEGGWVLLNYEKYRSIQTQRQKDDAERKRREYRKKQAETAETSATSTPYAEAEAEAKTTKKAEVPTWDDLTADQWFARCWDDYPKRPGNSKRAARQAWDARLKQGVPPPILHTKTLEFAGQMRREARPPDKIKMAATFYGPSFDPETDYGPTGTIREQRTDDYGELHWGVVDPRTGEWTQALE